jgi:hypothetical protein
MNVRVVWSLLKGTMIKRDCFDITTLMLKTIPDISESPQVIRIHVKNALLARKCAAIILSF